MMLAAAATAGTSLLLLLLARGLLAAVTNTICTVVRLFRSVVWLAVVLRLLLLLLHAWL